MALVVDTDVASFLFKNDTRAALYVPHPSGHMLTVSFQTLAELELWALAAGWGESRRQRLARYLRRYLVEDSSPALCRRWAEALDDARRRGRPIAAADAWVAATALLLDVPLVT
ncbi:MAG: type II toxin-antitoxin system VapC family toxin [Acidobacteriota bacterium]|nr:type II toxin-antitoxin system VapC family toxin [Acidobacteriota bacterium]